MPERGVLRVLVVDDEPLGLERIAELVRAQADAELVGTADDGATAIAEIRRLEPDLVFLDIQMPARSGLDVVAEIGPERMPATVFVTAHDQFALQAFETSAVDYLVKPFDDERFDDAFRRARHRIGLETIDRMRAGMLALLGEHEALARGVLDGAIVEGSPPGGAPRYRERITVRTKGRMRVVPVALIDSITASGSYAELHVGSTTHLVRESMQTLEDELDPDVFMRIHRSVIVRLDRIELLLRGTGGDYAVQLKGGEVVSVGRSRLVALEEKLGAR